MELESAYSDSDDTAFLPASASPGPSVRKRQRSVGDMIRRLDQKKQRMVSPKGKGLKDTEFLEEIKAMMRSCVEEGNNKLWQKVESKISAYEDRMDRLEGEIFVRDQRIDQLQSELRVCHAAMEGYEERLDSIERHSRAVNLVLSSRRFGKRRDGEDIAGMAVKLINDNFKDVQVTKDDFSTIHRLSNENAVICVFRDKNLRNRLYEDRIRMRHQPDLANRLFVSENLTRANSAIFNRLLQLKRSGRVWAVFSKAGVPCYKPSKLSSPIRVHNMQQVTVAERDLPLARPGLGRSAAPPPPPPLPQRDGPGRPVRGAGHTRPGRGGGGAGLPDSVTAPGSPGELSSCERPVTAGAAADPESRRAGGSVVRLPGEAGCLTDPALASAVAADAVAPILAEPVGVQSTVASPSVPAASGGSEPGPASGSCSTVTCTTATSSSLAGSLRRASSGEA